MNVKRYIASDMQEALTKIRAELGSDAVLLSTHPVRKKGIRGFFEKAKTEVVVAYEPKAPPKPPRREEYAAPLPMAPMPAPTPNPAPMQFTPPQVSAFEPVAIPTPPPQNNAAQTSAPEPAPAARDETNSVSRAEKSRRDDSGHDEHNARLADMDMRISDIQDMLKSFTGKLSSVHTDVSHQYSPEIGQLVNQMVENDVYVDLAHKYAAEAQTIVNKYGAEPLEVLEQLVKQGLGEPSPIRPRKFQRTVVMMVGPTGVGKTTTLVKLAAHMAHSRDARVAMINNDTYRVAAQEQLKTYAEILESPITVAYSPQEVAHALEQYRDYDFVFIDTSGRSPSDKKHKEDIDRILQICNIDEVFLVMCASTGIKACKEIIEQHSFLKNYKLLITKVDETSTAGTFLNSCAFSGMPLSYVATGQGVPDDIEVVDVQSIVNRLWG